MQGEPCRQTLCRNAWSVSLLADRKILFFGGRWFSEPTPAHFVARALSKQSVVIWIQCPESTDADANPIRRIMRMACRRRPITRVDRGLFTASADGCELSNAPSAGRLIASLAAWLARESPGGKIEAWSMNAAILDRLASKRISRRVQLVTSTGSCPGASGAGDSQRAAIASIREWEQTRNAGLFPPPQSQHRNPTIERLTIVRGVDFPHYAISPWLGEAATPPEFRGLRSPLVGYFGPIDREVDIDLIVGAARLEPNWSFALCGQQLADVTALRACDNVFMIPPRPYTVLPAYFRALDVGFLPLRSHAPRYRAGALGHRDYLAAGVPIISTPSMEVIATDRAVFLAETPEQFVVAAQRAQRFSRVHGRLGAQEVVHGEDWDSRIAELEPDGSANMCIGVERE